MATEIAIFPLKDGKIPDDANSQPGQVLKETLNTLTEQRGFQRAYWGREVENPDVLRLFVDWDTVDAHIDFTKTDHYKPFLDRFAMIADLDKAEMYHANLTPHPASEVLSDRVTPACECLMVYFPSDYSSDDQDKFVEDVKKLVKAVEDNADTYTGSAGGWVKEELPIPGTSEKGKAWAGFIGWKSVEAHMQFRGTQVFKDNIHWLRGAKDLKHVKVIHTAGTEVQAGAGGVGDMSGDALPSVQGEVLNPQGGPQSPPKTSADGTTTKNNDDLKGAANSTKSERQGRGQAGGDAFA